MSERALVVCGHVRVVGGVCVWWESDSAKLGRHAVRRLPTVRLAPAKRARSAAGPLKNASRGGARRWLGAVGARGGEQGSVRRAQVGVENAVKQDVLGVLHSPRHARRSAVLALALDARAADGASQVILLFGAPAEARLVWFKQVPSRQKQSRCSLITESGGTTVAAPRASLQVEGGAKQIPCGSLYESSGRAVACACHCHFMLSTVVV